MAVVVSLSLAACSGVNSPTAADSTTLYTGPLPKDAPFSKNDTPGIGNLKVGPDNFTAGDTSKRAITGKKVAPTE